NAPHGNLTLDATPLANGTVSNHLKFSLPIAERADVRWSVEGSPDLVRWQALGLRVASNVWSGLSSGDSATETQLDSVRSVRFSHLENRDHYFMRLKAGLTAPKDYANDFSTNVVAYKNTNPHSNSANVPVQVSFTPTNGASVRFGETQVF